MDKPVDKTDLDHQFDRKDQSENYLKYRPSYPKGFIESMFKQAYEEAKEKSSDGKVNAIDLACGSGQLTQKILPYFDKIIGVDFSEAQLANATKAFESEIASKKIKFLQFDCSKIDELLELPEIKELNPQFIFMGQAFHWFDYDDFLNRFKKATLHNNLTLVLVGYRVLELVEQPLFVKEAVDKFVASTNPYFKCNRQSLEDEYKEYDFTRFFQEVKFERAEEFVDAPVQSLMGYFDTWSAYRNYLSHSSNVGKEDPLCELMKDLRLKNFETKEFDKLVVSEGAVSRIQYKNRFFAYALRLLKVKH